MAADLCKKQCLRVGFTSKILEIALKWATTVWKEQCLWVGLIGTILEIAFKGAAKCMQETMPLDRNYVYKSENHP